VLLQAETEGTEVTEGTLGSEWPPRGRGGAPQARTWASLDHHAAPDVVRPHGDPLVGAIRLRLFAGPPVPAVACVTVGEGFG
jgi:hypothetical protein